MNIISLDDLKSKIFAKKIIDHLGLAVANYSSFVDHKKAPNTFKNLQKEANGIEVNEKLYFDIKLSTTSQKFNLLK